jgi:Homeodomain-like domain
VNNGTEERPDPQVRLRAHLILLLADGHAWALIAAVLFCSTATIARWKDRFQEAASTRCWTTAAVGPDRPAARSAASGWPRSSAGRRR